MAGELRIVVFVKRTYVYQSVVTDGIKHNGTSNCLTEVVDRIRDAAIMRSTGEAPEIIRCRINGAVRSGTESVARDGATGESPDYLARGVDSVSLAKSGIVRESSEVIRLGVDGLVWSSTDGVSSKRNA